MNKQVVFNELGGIEVLKIEDQIIPTPAPNEVLVQVKACGLNRAEYLFFQGQYLFQPNLPSKVGMEGAGVIQEIGSNVTGFNKGDSVCLLPNVDITNYGYLGEYITVPFNHIILAPKNMDFLQAATFWIPYGTAYGILIQKGGLKKNTNQTVVITAASSSVGIASIQLAKNFGAKVIATTRTSAKKEFLSKVGADEVIITEEENLQERISSITNNKGFDICVDPITGSIINLLAEVAAQEAKIVIYGILNPTESIVPIYPLLTKGVTISGFHLSFHLLDIPKRKQAMEDFLKKGYEAGNFNIIIDRIYSLDAIKDAYTYMESNKQKGKIAIEI